jgi:ABC-type nickel/cobalt efflux system permease component RcnA
MRLILIPLLVLGLLCAWSGPVWSHNPFTSKPETQHKAPSPMIKSAFFVKIIVWQHQLKQKMSDLIRAVRTEKSLQPLIVLMGLAILYGVIHAAGPGHGKVVAMSYVLSHRATIMGGILFGLCFAVVHALSGAVGVVGLHYLIHRSVSETLASVTTVTQIVSFGLITLLGLGILLKHGYPFLKLGPDKATQSENQNKKGLFAWALAIGLVPCPAVVMIMLFCLSMNVMLLGLLLTICISMGMATTISLVVIALVLGKTGILTTVSEKYSIRIEGIIGLLSGGAVAVFGALLLLATINSAIHL